jgi:replicative DNA helicase
VDRLGDARSPSVPVRCVEVDNADHLYLATRSMIPTHNSTLGPRHRPQRSVKHGLASCIFSLEMSKTEITMRLLSAEARVPLHHMRAGTMTDDDWARLARAWARSPRRRCSSTTRPTSR